MTRLTGLMYMLIGWAILCIPLIVAYKRYGEPINESLEKLLSELNLQQRIALVASIYTSGTMLLFGAMLLFANWRIKL